MKHRPSDNGLKSDLNGNKNRAGLFSRGSSLSRGSSPYQERVYSSQQNLYQPDNFNANLFRPSSNIYIPSSFDPKSKSRLSPIHTRLRCFDNDIPIIEKDGRENSEKMLESRMEDVKISDVARAPADGSSRQNSFCIQTDNNESNEKDTMDDEISTSDEKIQSLTSQCKELDASNRVGEVRSERLQEHVKVLSRKIKFVECKLEETEAQLKKERVKSAKLEKSLEKAQIDLKSILTPYRSKYGKVALDHSNWSVF